MGISGLTVLRRKEHDRLIGIEKKYNRLTDRDEHGRFVRKESNER